MTIYLILIILFWFIFACILPLDDPLEGTMVGLWLAIVWPISLIGFLVFFWVKRIKRLTEENS